MDQDLTITAIDLITIQNYTRAAELMKGHLERAKPFFEQIISKKKLKERGIKMEYSRCSHLIESGSICILYYISFEGKMHVDIWLHKTDPKLLIFEECVGNYLSIQKDNGLKLYQNEHGSSISLSKPLSQFLDDEQGDMKILEWFKYAFEEIKKFIDFSKDEIEWNI
jgi:hypothetical protein